MAYVGPPGLFWPEAERVHVSVTFTWDIPEAERLARAWADMTGLPVSIGGPATGMRGEDFEPGMYLAPGMIITSRGCPNHCWFCSVPEREGDLRELPIRDGWLVQDDNLLACSRAHIEKVFDMLARQPKRPEFTGGLEAARLEPWMAERIRALYPHQLFFAYDTPSDLEPLREAGKMLVAGGFTVGSHDLRCYVLIGYRGDTFEKAEERLREAARAGFMPMAMLWRDPDTGATSRDWARFQRTWCRPAAIASVLKEER